MALFPILAITSGSLRLTLPLPGLMSPLRLLVGVAGDLGRGLTLQDLSTQGSYEESQGVMHITVFCGQLFIVLVDKDGRNSRYYVFVKTLECFTFGIVLIFCFDKSSTFILPFYHILCHEEKMSRVKYYDEQ